MGARQDRLHQDPPRDCSNQQQQQQQRQQQQHWRNRPEQLSFDPSTSDVLAQSSRKTRDERSPSSAASSHQRLQLASELARMETNRLEEQQDRAANLATDNSGNSRRAHASSPNGDNNEGVSSASSSSANKSSSSSSSSSSHQQSRQPDNMSQANNGGAEQAKHPLDAASLISELFFGWMFPFIWLGWRKGLKRADLPQRPSAAESCHLIGGTLVVNWNRELASCQQDSLKGRKPSLVRAVVRTHARRILLNSLLTFFSEVVCKSLSAYSVGQMLMYMNQAPPIERSLDVAPTTTTASSSYTSRTIQAISNLDPLILWTLTLMTAVWLWVLSAHFYGFQMMRVGLHLRVGCSHLIYRKSLRLGQQGSGQNQATTMGRMTNLLSNDLDKFNYVCIMLPFLWVGPLQTIVSLYLLWPLLGESCLAALLVLALLIPLQFYLSSRFASFRCRIAACTDERVRLLNEAISSLRLIKLYAWEYPFRTQLESTRRRETDLINRVAIIKGISVALMYVSSKMVLFVTVIFHCLIFGKTLDAKTLFMSMAMLNNVQFTMTQLMPRVVSLGVESLVSLRRIRDFLLEEEFKMSHRLRLDPPSVDDWWINKQMYRVVVDNNKLAAPRSPHLHARRPALIECRSLGACWPKAETKTLDDISFRCDSPGLIIMTGQVASGKTSLFMTLLNELPIGEGQARMLGLCGYASQIAWIFGGTVRENILFGLNYDEQRYRDVLDCCALKHDLELLEHGDLTYIQENSLSGGQKARINLARCLYRDCDIYLLDDPLAAVDGRVADHIFERAIKGFLADKLVLMSTHKASLFEQCNKLLVLHQGKLVAFSRPAELRLRLLDKNGIYFTADQLEGLSFLIDALVSSGSRLSENGLGDNNRINRIEKHDRNRPIIIKAISMEISAETERTHQRTKSNKNFIDGRREETPKANKNSVAVRSLSAQERGSGPQLNNYSQQRKLPKDSQTTGLSISQAKTEEPGLTLVGSNSNVKTGDEKATSGLVHAPYGSVDSAPLEDENLITNSKEAADSNHPIQANSIAIADHGASQSGETTRGALSAERKDAGGIQDEAKEEKPTSKVLENRYEEREQQQKQAGLAIGEAILRNTRACYRTTKNGVQTPSDSLEKKTLSAPESRECGDHNKQLPTRAKFDGDDIGETKPEKSFAIFKANKQPSEQPYRGPADEETSSKRLSGLRVWYKYYTQTSVIRLALLVLTFLTTQALFSTVDIYLTVWSLLEQNKALLLDITGANQQQMASFKALAACNRSNVIGYSLIPAAELLLLAMPTLAAPALSNLLSSSASTMLVKYNCTNDGVVLIEIGREIENVSISPLSSRSSQREPLVAPMGNLLVPMVDLLRSSSNLVEYDYSLSKFRKQKFAHQITTPQPPPTSTDHTTNNAITNIEPENASNSDRTLVDRDIYEESEAVLNVKSIYRPLYMFVNNFTSGQHALTYTILLMALFSCSMMTNVLSLTSSNKSAIALYRKLTHNALFAKLAFFDQNPPGRLLNRATRDIGIIDEAIPYNANQAYDALLQTAATFLIVAAVDVQLAMPSLIILFIFLIFHSIHVKPTKDIQRLEGIARSPIITHISSTLTGLQTIRATKSEHRFEQLFMRHQDAHTSVFLLYLGCNRTMAVVLDGLNATYTGIIAFWAVVSGLSGPSAGLIITSAMLLSGLTQHGVMKLTETESLMTSVERVIEYCNLPQEENYDTRLHASREVVRGGGEAELGKRGGKRNNAVANLRHSPPMYYGRIWPSDGCVEYRNVDLYYNRLGKPVLKNISFRLNAGEKVGIIGRTGAGKSSIITTLFRLYDYDGTILIDGVDLKKVDLFELRSAIAIIPQQPVLFSTTIRQNLDPLNLYDDYSIWAALDKAHLRATISALPGKLNYNIGNSGGGFSSGQRQLICLVRVLLRQSSVIVMDEATANVDPNTDSIIQTTIRREFKHCTVITIAHRLETIIDCNRIMVLDAGRIVDFDTPERLAAKNDSYFSTLLREEQNGQSTVD